MAWSGVTECLCGRNRGGHVGPSQGERGDWVWGRPFVELDELMMTGEGLAAFGGAAEQPEEDVVMVARGEHIVLTERPGRESSRRSPALSRACELRFVVLFRWAGSRTVSRRARDPPGAFFFVWALGCLPRGTWPPSCRVGSMACRRLKVPRRRRVRSQSSGKPHSSAAAGLPRRDGELRNIRPGADNTSCRDCEEGREGGGGPPSAAAPILSGFGWILRPPGGRPRTGNLNIKAGGWTFTSKGQEHLRPPQAARDAVLGNRDPDHPSGRCRTNIAGEGSPQVVFCPRPRFLLSR